MVEPASTSSSERFHPEARTFTNRGGEVEATHTWFASDDIVALRTPPTTGPETHECIFLASRGILCRDSLVFKDILSLPSPETPREEDVYDGHPLITVQDTPQDVQDFLEAIHDWRAYSDSPKAKSIPRIAALLRLGTKYQVSFLRRKMLDKLGRRLPQTLAQFNKANPNDSPHPDRPKQGEDLIILAALEAEVDHPILLACITYLCGQGIGIAEITQGVIRESPPADSNVVWFINEQSRARVVRAHVAIGKLYLSNLMASLAVRHRDCVTPSQCNTILALWPFWFDEEGSRMTLFSDLVNPCCLDCEAYSFEGESHAGHPGLCELCFAAARGALEPLLVETWEMLPELMGMGTWEDLRMETVLRNGVDEGDSEGSEV